MAPTRRQRFVEAPARKVDAQVTKENISPRVFSTKALFKRGHERVRKGHTNKLDARFGLARLSTPILAPSTKVKLGKSILVKRPLSPPRKPALHPIVTDFNETTTNYRNTVKHAVQDSVEPAYIDLVERLHRISLQSDSGLTAQLAEAAKISSTMTVPLDSDFIPARRTDDQGHHTAKEYLLGETVASFTDKLEEKRDQISKLWCEWENVRQEIAELGAEMLDEPSFPRQFGLTPLEGAQAVCMNSSATNDQIASLREAIRAATDKSMVRVNGEAQINIKERAKTRQLWLSFLQTTES